MNTQPGKTALRGCHHEVCVPHPQHVQILLIKISQTLAAGNNRNVGVVLPGSLLRGLGAAVEMLTGAVVSSEGLPGAGSASKPTHVAVGRIPAPHGLLGGGCPLVLALGISDSWLRKVSTIGLLETWHPITFALSHWLATFTGRGLHVAVTTRRLGSLEGGRGSASWAPCQQ